MMNYPTTNNDLLMELARELAALRQRVAALEAADAAPEVIWLRDGATAPTAVVGLVALWADSGDGDLKARFGDGVTKTIVADT